MGCSCNYAIRGRTGLLVKTCSAVQSMSSPKLIGSPLKRLNKDKMNGIGRLHMQLRYSLLNNFVGKNQESTMDENDFEIP